MPEAVRETARKAQTRLTGRYRGLIARGRRRESIARFQSSEQSEACTRGCTFCNVATGRPDALDAFEPERVAAARFAQTIRAIRRRTPGLYPEVRPGARYFHSCA